MNIQIRPIDPVNRAFFAGVVSGLDLARPLSTQEVAAVHAGMNEFGVLVFHDQKISDDQQLVFSRSLGPLELATGDIAAPEERRVSMDLNDISNLDKNNRILARDDRRRLFGLGNQLWHSDSSYKAIPARYSLLCAHVIPPEGGNTDFADMRAAYDAFDAKTKALVEALVCEHSRIFSKGALGISFTEEELRAFAPVRQRLVRTHRKTGRKSLYLSSHAGRIVGWPVPEAMLLLRELTEHATQREFVYSHKWQVGDLVMWDNRTVMHRARRYEDEKYPRDLRRTTLTDGVPTIAQPKAA